MPKPKRAIRPVEKTVSLPEDLVARVDLTLFSEVEGKVPHGAWARFVEARLREYFEKQARAAALSEKIARLAAQECVETRHGDLDRALCEELVVLGYGAAVEQFRAAGKWYA